MKGKHSPSTTVGDNNKRTEGQGHTMKGAAGGPARPCPNKQLNSSKDITIDPCSSMGAKKFEKK